MIVFAWVVIGIIAARLYKKQSEKPQLWKVVLVVLIGLFSFAINLEIFGEVLKISVLPLGVWILYWFLRKKKITWQKYQPFAWLGFGANFILMAFLLIGIPIHYLLYPENEPSTYISNVEGAYIIKTNPTAIESSLMKEDLIDLIQGAKQQNYFSDSWYNETFMEPDKTTERFPYMLANSLPKWGSGLHTTVYLEKNGKGVLITTQEKQFYFQTEHSLLEEGDK